MSDTTINQERRGLFGSLLSNVSNSVKNVKSEIAKDNKPKTFLIAPPYNNDKSLFQSECLSCDGICGTVCEEDIIKFSEEHMPYLAFSISGCTFCEECAKACESREYEEDHTPPLSLKNEEKINVSLSIVDDACLAWNKTMCFSCKEPCLENAIIFDGLFKPVIDMEKCTSCGFCVSRCPTSAIIVHQNSEGK